MLFPIQAGTVPAVLTVVASILAAAVGALLGSYATYRGQKRREREKEADEIQKLRIGLRSELMQIRAHSVRLNELIGNDGIEYDIIRTSSVSTSVYESNIDKISMLSEREIVLLSTLYNKLIQNNEALRAGAEASFSKGYSMNIDDLGDYPENLIRITNATISEIESKLNESGVNLDLMNSILDDAVSENSSSEDSSGDGVSVFDNSTSKGGAEDNQ